jgi:hypothetical protein
MEQPDAMQPIDGKKKYGCKTYWKMAGEVHND